METVDKAAERPIVASEDVTSGKIEPFDPGRANGESRRNSSKVGYRKAEDDDTVAMGIRSTKDIGFKACFSASGFKSDERLHCLEL